MLLTTAPGGRRLTDDPALMILFAAVVTFRYGMRGARQVRGESGESGVMYTLSRAARPTVDVVAGGDGPPAAGPLLRPRRGRVA